jgi:hypothetical protein
MENVSCSLDSKNLADRRERWHRLAAQAFSERALTERGQRLVFRRRAGVEDELRELAELERKCCAFADWTIGAADGTVTLDVVGSSEEGVAAVQTMFGSLTAGGNG